MTEFKWTNPTARKRHRCECCSWDIMPGETYYRIAGLDRSVAWTIKQCEHCARVTSQYSREHYGDEWEIECVLEWLEDEHPFVSRQMQAGWRYPDGERLPLPFQRRCFTCAVLLSGDFLWCEACDAARIQRISQSLEAIRDELGRVVR